jgi:hypothetical protein
MTVLNRLGTRLSEYVSAVARSPPLLGLVVGAWIAALSMFTAANPVTAFLVVAPATMLLWYGVLYAAGRLRGTSDESVGFGATDSEGVDAAKTTETGSIEFFGGGNDDAPDERPIRRLRSRYAAGEIDHAEFERRLEALVETERLSDEGSDSEFGGVETGSVEREQ